MTTAVVICAYSLDRLGELLEAVASVRSQTRPPDEVIVAVDHNDELAGRLRREGCDAAVVENGGPAGLSGARNAGVAAASADVVAFLDDDAAAAPDWLERLTAHYARPDVAGVGGWVEPVWSQPRPGWFPEEFGWVVGCAYVGLPRAVAPVRNFIGANMSFRRALLVEAGGFRPGVGRVGARATGGRILAAARRPRECEETELCIRLGSRLPGTVLLFEPAARIFHHVPPERSSWGYFVSRCYGEGASKALIARIAGRARGLSAERAYARKVLPRGIAAALGEAARERRADPARRALAIAGGFGATAAGYALGSLFGPSPRV